MTIPWRPVYPFCEGNPDPWRTRVDGNTTLDPNSAQICAYLIATLTSDGPLNAVNAPLYIVGPEQPMVPVSIQESWEPFAQYINEIPIPAGAAPSSGSDHYLFVVQQTPLGQNDRMWELWEAAHNVTTGAWSATLGIRRNRIRTTNPGYSRNVQDPSGNDLEQPIWGVAGSRLSLGAGVIQIAEWQAGEINHALQMNVGHSRAGQWAFPAQWTDGTDTAQYSIPEGAKFRLDPIVDLTTLGLTPEMLVFATACQRYGMFVGDQTQHTVGFVFEDETQYVAQVGHSFYGNDWLTPGDPAFYLQKFPWQHLQLLPMDLRTTQDNTLFVEADPVLTYSFGTSMVGGAPVDLGNDPSLQLAAGSLEAWFSTSTPAPVSGTYSGMVAKPDAYFLGIDTAGNLVTYSFGGTRGSRSSGKNVCDGQIHHAVLTFQSGVTNGSVLYLDGKPVLTTTITVEDQGSDAVLGSNVPGQEWTGALDGCGIFGYVLTPAQVAARFAAGA